MQQRKFSYNIRLINFMRILSVAANSVNEIYMYFMNAYDDKLILLTTNNLICLCGEQDCELVNNKRYQFLKESSFSVTSPAS